LTPSTYYQLRNGLGILFSVPSVVRKTGFALDLEPPIFVVKNPDRKPSARETTPLRNEVERIS